GRTFTLGGDLVAGRAEGGVGGGSHRGVLARHRGGRAAGGFVVGSGVFVAVATGGEPEGHGERECSQAGGASRELHDVAFRDFGWESGCLPRSPTAALVAAGMCSAVPAGRRMGGSGNFLENSSSSRGFTPQETLASTSWTPLEPHGNGVRRFASWTVQS